MKTIDLLVQELPALGGWPDGAVEAGFLCSDDTLFFVNKDGDCPSGWCINMNHEVEDNGIEVTREQYEAALAAKNEGWIEWRGGRPPVDKDTMVDIKFRTGGIVYDVEAGKYYWPRTGQEYDIIAYRQHQPQEAEQDKADLNECASQDAAPVWNGEDLPPVGCVCEFMKHTLDAMPNWRRGIIKYVSEYTVVIVEALSPGEFVAHPRTCDFRPIRSEAERKRDEAVAQLNNFVVMGKFALDEDLASAVYDAIAAGKITGVKLEV